MGSVQQLVLRPLHYLIDPLEKACLRWGVRGPEAWKTLVFLLLVAPCTFYCSLPSRPYPVGELGGICPPGAPPAPCELPSSFLSAVLPASALAGDATEAASCCMPVDGEGPALTYYQVLFDGTPPP